MNMNRLIARLCLCGLVTMHAYCLAAEDPAALRAARAKLVGPAIATTSEYTVHSPQATKRGNGYQCGRGAGPSMSNEEYYAEKAKIDEMAAKESEVASEELARLNREYRANPALKNDPAWQRKFDAANAANSAVTTRQQQRMVPLDKKWQESRAASVNAVTLYFLHTPTDPNKTIVPLEGLVPTSAFVADLNRVLRPFLATCAATEWAIMYHYYRDDIPFGRVVTDTLDPHIVFFQYILRAGTLSLKPGQVVSISQKIDNDPARNPRLTLAGLRTENAALSGETSRRSADYRRGQAVATNRKPGIVYKLDAYWTQYRKPDLARRIFDGDFGMDEKSSQYIYGGAKRYADTADFRLLYLNYADLYSARCKSFVRSWATLTEETRVNQRSELNPATGIFESKSDPKTVTRQIDARFARFYQRYQGELQNTLMAKTLGQMKAGERGERKRPIDMTVADAAQALKQQNAEMNDMAGIFPEFFGNHACTSATMTQLGDNIVRAANSQPSAQAQGMQYKGATQESDAPRR